MTDFAASLKETVPNPILRQTIESETRANSSPCWTCGTCDLECPVNIATNRLRPQVMVRLANLGFLDELTTRPEIWHCLSCRHCADVCPNLVKPASVIAFARYESVRSGKFSWNQVRRYQTLLARSQRVRWRAVEICLKGEFEGISESEWTEWLNTSVPQSASVISYGKMDKYLANLSGTNTNACFTCGECSSACPVSSERTAFDPRSIFRMVALGMTEFLLKSPFIWLCVGCGRCAEACPQLVDGRQVIRELRELAVREKIVDAWFPVRMELANRLIMHRFLDETDRIFGFQTK